MGRQSVPRRAGGTSGGLAAALVNCGNTDMEIRMDIHEMLDRVPYRERKDCEVRTGCGLLTSELLMEIRQDESTEYKTISDRLKSTIPNLRSIPSTCRKFYLTKT